MRVVEDDVDAAPLLEHRQHHADDEDGAHRGFAQLRQRYLVRRLPHQSLADLGQRLLGIGIPANLAEHAGRQLILAIFGQPAR